MLVVAVLSLGIGLFLVVFPGPAIPFLLVAGALLALESRDVARFMDWLEIRGRRVWLWLRAYWQRTPLLGRVLLVVLAGGMSATCTYFAYRIMRG